MGNHLIHNSPQFYQRHVIRLKKIIFVHNHPYRIVNVWHECHSTIHLFVFWNIEPLQSESLLTNKGYFKILLLSKIIQYINFTHQLMNKTADCNSIAVKQCTFYDNDLAYWKWSLIFGELQEFLQIEIEINIFKKWIP